MEMMDHMQGGTPPRLFLFLCVAQATAVKTTNKIYCCCTLKSISGSLLSSDPMKLA